MASSTAVSPHALRVDGHTVCYTSPQASPSAMPPAPEMDTTMEEADDEDDEAAKPNQPVEDEFAFNAPSYYDLKHPEMERQYVNNADGYFYTEEHPVSNNALLQTPPRPTRPHSDSTRTPQTPYGTYRQPQKELVDEEMDLADDESRPQSSPDDNDGMSEAGSYGAEELETARDSLGNQHPTYPFSSSSSTVLSTGPSVSSKLLQPTKAFLMRVQAEQEARSMATEGSHAQKTSRLTHPRSPHLQTSQKAQQRQNAIRLSSTSRELQKIRAEKMRVQMEAVKIREYHEKMKAHRPPANVHQRSTKQLTIPQSPLLAVDQRGRRHSQEENTNSGSKPMAFIKPEQLLSRDYELPTHSSHAPRASNEKTVPHAPHFRTAERAARRSVFPEDQVNQQPATKDYSKMKVNGLTKPMPPQLETDRRAQISAAYRKPIDVVDKDEEELSRKFHAKPVNRKIFSAPKPRSPRRQKQPLTRPISPKFATGARIRQNAVLEIEKEKRQAQKQAAAASSGPRRPVIPETPPLQSIHRHRQFQENMRRKMEAEEEEMRRQREFRAQPMRVTSTPPPFQGSKKPLTEAVPFSLEGERFHERAQERVQQIRMEEEERLLAEAHFKAMPMPDSHSSTAGLHRVPARPLTQAMSPMLMSNRRAVERAAFDEAERERRAQEEAEKQRQEEERRRQEEEELKRLRREELVFHARPVPQTKPFEVKPANRTLTEPESPFLMTKVRAVHSATSSA